MLDQKNRKMKSLLTTLILLIPILTIGQSRIDTLFAIADHHFKNKEYDEAKSKYGDIKLELEKGTNDYSYAADQIAMIYFFQRNELRAEGKYKKSIAYLKAFIQYIEAEKDFIRDLWYKEKRYFLFRVSSERG